MITDIQTAIYRLVKRAEKLDKEHILQTFVDVGPLLTLLTNPDHQIIYGRRGTGKTHALSYLTEELGRKGHLPVYIDMREIGSNGGIYSDSIISITERATRLLIDTFQLIHDEILNFVLINDTVHDLSRFGPILDDLRLAISEILVVGTIELEQSEFDKSSQSSEMSLGVSLKDINVSGKDVFGLESSFNKRAKTSGVSTHRVHFTTITSSLRRLKELLNNTEIWVILDEWAEVPLDLQPYLADLLRRTLFPIKGITVKIGAIEKRTNFKLQGSTNYIGIETGADISATLNLDEFMVFDNDKDKSKDFFSALIYNHVNQYLEENGKGIADKDTFVNMTFTQIGAFEELVRASEGIPRDAINILIHSAIKSNNTKISIPSIRTAARQWYNTDKEKAINSNREARLLLRWIIDEVIGRRNSRAFLLSNEVDNETIEYLFDNRIIHLIKQNIASKENTGERYNVFAIDYGTYVHLINTNDEPKGLFEAETDDEGATFVEVPANDYRSIRRSILNLDTFYIRNASIPPQRAISSDDTSSE